MIHTDYVVRTVVNAKPLMTFYWEHKSSTAISLKSNNKLTFLNLLDTFFILRGQCKKTKLNIIAVRTRTYNKFNTVIICLDLNVEKYTEIKAILCKYNLKK